MVYHILMPWSPDRGLEEGSEYVLGLPHRFAAVRIRCNRDPEQSAKLRTLSLLQLDVEDIVYHHNAEMPEAPCVYVSVSALAYTVSATCGRTHSSPCQVCLRIKWPFWSHA